MAYNNLENYVQRPLDNPEHPGALGLGQSRGLHCRPRFLC